MKNTNQKLKTAIILNTVIFILGTLANPYFALIALGYIVTMLTVYLFANKIKDLVINMGYIWISKWSVFVVFLALSGIYMPDVFLYSLLMFVVFNLSVNPSLFISKNSLER